MDLKAFYKLSYGLYIVSSNLDGKQCGCIVNTVVQVTAEPVQLAVTVNKDNYTKKAIEKSGSFTAVALTQSADMNLIGTFGFKCSADMDKFEGLQTETDEQGIAYVTQNAAARFSCKVLQQVDLGTHVMFIGEVLAAEILSDEDVMTYAYYQTVKKGGTPKSAPSYKGEAAQPEAPVKKGFRCSICGYILEADTLPADYVCPICGKSAEFFTSLN